MKNISFFFFFFFFFVFLSKNIQFLEVKFSIYLNRRVFVMGTPRPIVNEESPPIAYAFNSLQAIEEEYTRILAILVE